MRLAPLLAALLTASALSACATVEAGAPGGLSERNRTLMTAGQGRSPYGLFLAGEAALSAGRSDEAAALFARGIVGQNAAAVYDVRQALAEWLSGSGTMPRWPGLEVLAPALPHKGRHAAIMLPWDAALQALSISGPAD